MPDVTGSHTSKLNDLSGYDEHEQVNHEGESLWDAVEGGSNNVSDSESAEVSVDVDVTSGQAAMPQPAPSPTSRFARDWQASCTQHRSES